MLLLTVAALFIAACGVVFALQNNIPVAVTFLQWRFDSSLAMALLLALAAGAIIAALLSAPATMRRRWQLKRHRRTIAELEGEIADLKRQLERPREGDAAQQVPPEPPAYVGLKTLIGGRSESRDP